LACERNFARANVVVIVKSGAHFFPTFWARSRHGDLTLIGRHVRKNCLNEIAIHTPRNVVLATHDDQMILATHRARSFVDLVAHGTFCTFGKN
jgi:NADH:ubiquinone oxidoreductase subunit F (NADH-binding)